MSVSRNSSLARQTYSQPYPRNKQISSQDDRIQAGSNSQTKIQKNPTSRHVELEKVKTSNQDAAFEYWNSLAHEVLQENNDSNPYDRNKNASSLLYAQDESSPSVKSFHRLFNQTNANLKSQNSNSSSLKNFLKSEELFSRLLPFKHPKKDAEKRPQTARDSLNKHRMKISNGFDLDSAAENDSHKDEKEEICKSIIEDELEVNKQESTHRSRRSTLTSQLKTSRRFIPPGGAIKEANLIGTPRSNRSFSNLLRIPLGHPSNQKEEKNKDISLQNDSKISLNFSKILEYEEIKTANNPKIEIPLRRKSDISKYSGGECHKLKKHLDIILPSDKNNRNFPKSPSLTSITTKTEELMVKSIVRIKSTKESISPRKELRSQTSARNSPIRNPLETIRSYNNFWEQEAMSKTQGLTLKIKPTVQKKNNLIKFRSMDPSILKTSQEKNFSGLDKNPDHKNQDCTSLQKSRKSSMCEKNLIESTIRSFASYKTFYQSNSKQKNLKNDLQMVLSLTKKAQNTLVHTNSIEPPNDNLKHSSNQDKRYDCAAIQERRKSSCPYFQPINFRRDGTKAFLISANPNKKDIIMKPLKLKIPAKKSESFKLRSKSVPKILIFPSLNGSSSRNYEDL